MISGGGGHYFCTASLRALCSIVWCPRGDIRVAATWRKRCHVRASVLRDDLPSNKSL